MRAVALRALVVFALVVPLLALSPGAASASTASDNFNRPNGSLGAGWTDMSDGGLAIASQAVIGTSASYSGDIRTREVYSSDQSSQISVTGTQLSGGQWIGPAVRAQNGGQNLYLGLYWWNGGSPQLMLFKRTSGNWTGLGSAVATGPLAAGTTLTLTASGSTLSFLVNGVVAISATDTTLTGGAPGIMAYGAATAGNWVGGGVTASNYAIGGTISGLSGTVVLQDNGASNLTTATNGPFSFGTLLPSGATYNVTVATNPPGQACTVANGSGTVGSADVTNVSVTCSTKAGTTASDNFNRPNGSLGAGWTDMSDGGLAIASQAVIGTSASNSGDIRTREVYSSDQSSQISVTGTQLSGGQWIGPAVRAQNGGQNLYLGLYWWNGGSPQLMLFKRTSGNWTGLGSAVATGPLAAGTTLTLTASGSTLSFLVNGVVAISATDTTLTGGAPGIMAYGAATAGNWVGGGVTSVPTAYAIGGTISGLSGTVVLQDNGASNLTTATNGPFSFGPLLPSGATYNVTVATNPPSQACTVANGSGTVGSADVTNVSVTCSTILQVQYLGTDATGVESYSVTSPDDGYGSQTLRVLRPTHPAAGVAHNFIYVLPVTAGLDTTYGDGLATLQALDAEDQYNLTIIEPTFAIAPWYSNSSTDPALQYETFMASDLVPWVSAHLATTHTERNWLIGFSKSGIGGQDLILKHPDVFSIAASWDFPADMSTYNQFYGAAQAYGTDANFQANYRLTSTFVDAHAAPFLTHNRIWIGGYERLPDRRVRLWRRLDVRRHPAHHRPVTTHGAPVGQRLGPRCSRRPLPGQPHPPTGALEARASSGSSRGGGGESTPQGLGGSGDGRARGMDRGHAGAIGRRCGAGHTHPWRRRTDRHLDRNPYSHPLCRQRPVRDGG